LGNYITVSSITTAIGTPRLAILCSNGSGGVSTAAVNAVIANAEAEVDSIIGPGFVVPQTSVAQVVKFYTTQIAIDFAYRGITEFRRADGKTPTYMDYENAVKALKELRSGERDMGNETTKSVIASGGVVYYTTTNFILDSDETTQAPSGGY